MHAPAMFQRIASNIFKNVAYVKIYIDDVIMGSRSMREHVCHLIEVCRQIKKIGLRVKFSKCGFAKDKKDRRLYCWLKSVGSRSENDFVCYECQPT